MVLLKLDIGLVRFSDVICLMLSSNPELLRGRTYKRSGLEEGNFTSPQCALHNRFQ